MVERERNLLSSAGGVGAFKGRKDFECREWKGTAGPGPGVASALTLK